MTTLLLSQDDVRLLDRVLSAVARGELIETDGADETQLLDIVSRLPLRLQQSSPGPTPQRQPRSLVPTVRRRCLQCGRIGIEHYLRRDGLVALAHFGDRGICSPGRVPFAAVALERLVSQEAA